MFIQTNLPILHGTLLYIQDKTYIKFTGRLDQELGLYLLQLIKIC
jgi:hypothetical protein